MNKLLSRQIKRKLGEDFEICDQMQEFIKIISESYDHFEKDREIIERAMTISSEELRESYGKLAVQKELERKNVELERFVSIASHDLKAPLRTISSFSGLLKKRLKDHEVFGSIEEFLSLIIASTERMETLIQDLLEYSRIENSLTEIEDVDLNHILTTVEKNVKGLLEENQATLNFENLPSVSAIPHQMLQLFQNLIGNAIKFKKEHVAPIVNVRCKENETAFVFAVEDNGIGIEEENLFKVFDAFKRLESGKKYQGTGLGLSICKSIVEKINGKIWVESEKGVGTTFLFSFPKSQATKEFVMNDVKVEVNSI